MDRRKFLKAASPIAATALSGCVGISIKAEGKSQEDLEWQVSYGQQSEYFGSIRVGEVDTLFMFNDSGIIVDLKETTEQSVDAIGLLHDGQTEDIVELETGESGASFHVDFADVKSNQIKLEVAAIHGGEEAGWSWDGGKTLEKATVSVTKKNAR